MSNLVLSREQFEVLAYLECMADKKSPREISKKTGLPLVEVGKAIEYLRTEQLLSGNKVTAKGYDALEPYKVKRAVFIAAGFGSRLVPVTLNTPKPLVRVQGVRMIDTLLDAVVAADIEEIYIVRGYLGERFDQLLYKYPMIKFIDNPLYNEANNISSAFCAREFLKSAYVLEADLVLYNRDIIRKYQYTSNYIGVPVKKTDDWCLEAENRVITKCALGGTDCYHMFGISYWSEEDGAKLKGDIKKVFEMPGGKECFWDQVPLDFCLENYRVEVRPCSFKDIVEIDSYNDLKKIDDVYV